MHIDIHTHTHTQRACNFNFKILLIAKNFSHCINTEIQNLVQISTPWWHEIVNSFWAERRKTSRKNSVVCQGTKISVDHQPICKDHQMVRPWNQKKRAPEWTLRKSVNIKPLPWYCWTRARTPGLDLVPMLGPWVPTQEGSRRCLQPGLPGRGSGASPMRGPAPDLWKQTHETVEPILFRLM